MSLLNSILSGTFCDTQIVKDLTVSLKVKVKVVREGCTVQLCVNLSLSCSIFIQFIMYCYISHIILWVLPIFV